MKLLTTLFKAIRRASSLLSDWWYTPMAKLSFRLNGVRFGRGLQVRGPIKVVVTRKGSMQVGDRLRMNSGDRFNLIGRQQRCIFWVDGDLRVGSNVGMSSCAIVCTLGVEIGDHAVIGGNTVIYDSDFHSLKVSDRHDRLLDRVGTKRAPVVIGKDVFIGGHSTILKGVTIGDGAVIGACSVVTKSVPAGELWAGNPAKFIRNLAESDSAKPW